MRKMVLVVLLCLVGASAHAANRYGAVTVATMIGNYNFDNDQNWRDANIYTVGLGYNFTQHWNLELAVAATDGVYERRPSKPKWSSTVMHFYKTNLQYNINPTDPAVIYLAGGVGVWSVNPKYASAYSELLASYGGGVKIDVSSNLSIRLDISSLIFSGEWMKDVHNTSYSLGLNSQFGGVSSRPVTIDADHDGIIDSLDECPGSLSGRLVNSSGCESEPVEEVAAASAIVESPQEVRQPPVETQVNAVLNTAPVVVEQKAAPVEEDVRFAEEMQNSAQQGNKKLSVAKGLVKKVNVTFDSGSTRVHPRYVDELSRVAAFINTYQTKKVVIEGHADSVGKAKTNLRLSQIRAENVRQYLIDNFGIDAQRISAVGYGEQNPVASNNTAWGRMQNRRVVVVVKDE